MPRKTTTPTSSPQPQRDVKKFSPYLAGAAAIIVLLGGLIAWGLLRDHSTATNTKNQGPASALTGVVSTGSAYTTCLAKFHDDNLCRFAATESTQPLNKTAYRATLNANQKGTVTGLIYSQDGQGNTTLTTTQNDAVQIDSIQYQGTLYTKNGNVWLKYPSDSSLSQLVGNPTSNLSFLNSLISENLTKVSSGTCGAYTCLKYQLIDSSTPQSTDYIWFDTQHYLLREWSSNDPTNGQIDMKINYQPIRITVPSPVQDITSGQ